MHCRECAEDLRSRGEGPVQVQRRASADSPYSIDTQAKEVSWTRAEENLVYYLNRFNRYPAYDGVVPSELHWLTDEDRQMANKIAARMSATTWAPVIGRSLAGIGDWDLLNMSGLEWEGHREAIREVLEALLIHPGIGVARLTKALHRKRPDLIPICDSVILKALGVRSISRADAIVTCMERFRVVGLKHTSTLQSLRGLSKQLHAEMTELRIIELLYWVQFGPFPLTSQKG